MLAEKNLKYESKIVDIYNNEQYSPQYMKLNPKGVVPTLVHNGIVVSNAIEIIQYIDSTFSIPTSPIDNIDYEKMMNWVRQMDEIPMEIIIFGKRLQVKNFSFFSSFFFFFFLFLSLFFFLLLFFFFF